MIADWVSTNLPVLEEIGLTPEGVLTQVEAAMDHIAEIWQPFAERFVALVRGELAQPGLPPGRELPLLGA